MIQLETSAKSLLTQLREIIIKDKFIYAVDKGQKAVFIFDQEGRFISKLDKFGEGPDQYRFLGPVFISEDEKFIEVVEMMGKNSRILKYSNITFEFIDSRQFSMPSANSWRRKNDIYYFSAQQHENEIGENVSNPDIIVVKEGDEQFALFDKRIETNNSSFSPNTESFTVNDQGDIYVSLMYHNTFYILEGIQANPVLSVDFGEYGIDNTMGQKSIEDQKDYLGKNTDGLASFPVLNVNSPELMSFSYYFKTSSKNKLYHYIHLKNSNKIFHVEDIINDLTSFPEKVYLSSYFFAVNHDVKIGDYLYDIILPWHSLGDNKEVEILEGRKIQNEDNPVIVKMKLKANL